ncbi:MAG: 4-hydroxy-3-methylbut-2-enyl diphosphate reductase [Elusimicrobiota bacterium]
MKIQVAKKSGFCYGVKKAVERAESAPSKYPGEICTIGHLIHNRFEVERLAKMGISVRHSINEVEGGTLLVRTHGLSKGVMEKLHKKDIKIIDATCPFVKRIHNLVEELSSKGYNIIVVGEKNHPETIGIISYSLTPVAVVESEEEINKIKLKQPVAVVSQTTQNVNRFAQLVEKIKKRFIDAKVYNTICNASAERQKNAEWLSRKVDVMIVIGGRDSANTRRLEEICSKFTKTYHIESADEIKSSWFKGIKCLGITAGASTPDWLISELTEKLKRRK